MTKIKARKVDSLTLNEWQKMKDEWKLTEQGRHQKNGYDIIRIDGTMLSTMRHYGGGTLDGELYTTFECKETTGELFCEFATIAVRMDVLKWVTKKLKEEAKESEAK